MYDYIVNKRALRIQHRGILRLADSEQRRIVHADVLHGSQRASRRAPGPYADVAHVADIEKANASAHGFVLRDQAAARRVLDRHIPAAKINHFRAQTAVQRVQRRLACFVSSGRVCGFHSDGSMQKIDTSTHPKTRQSSAPTSVKTS